MGLGRELLDLGQALARSAWPSYSRNAASMGGCQNYGPFLGPLN